MSKGDRSKASMQASINKRKLEDEAKDKERRKKILIGVGVAALIVLVFVGLIVATNINNRKLDSGDALRAATAAEGPTIKIDNAQMTYYFYSNLYSFLNYYGDYLNYIGLSTAVSLKSQEVEEGKTWFDYFAETTKNQVKQIVTLAEAATANGVTLSDSEIGVIDRNVSKIQDSAYGRGVKADDIARALKVSRLAVKYENQLTESFQPTQSEIDSRYAENPKLYQTVGYYNYSFAYVAEGEDGMTAETAKGYADRLAAATSPDAFAAELTAILKESGKFADEDKTEEEIDTSIESAVSAALSTDVAYTAEEEISEWAFGGAKVGETKLVDDTANTAYTVYMLVSEPARNEDPTVDVRHIYFMNSEYNDDAEAAKAEAERVYEEWKNAGATEDVFATLAYEYSNDSGSSAVGGLYRGVYEGQMIEEFNDWCFDSARKAGDCEVVKAENGTHIIYYVGDGLERWASDVRDDIVSERYSEKLVEIEKAYPVTVYDKVVNNITA